MYGTMMFAKALLCLGQHLMATQHALFMKHKKQSPYPVRNTLEQVRFAILGWLTGALPL